MAEKRSPGLGAIFANIIGAVDGYVVKIEFPKKATNPKKYFNRKGCYSVLLLICVDANGYIIYYDLQYAGATHDSTAYKGSDLSTWAKCGSFDRGGKRHFILGDAAFMTCSGVLAPYTRGSSEITMDEFNFNYFHSSLRIKVEQALGMMVAKFGILKTYLRHSLDINKKIVAACINLHNFLLSKKSTDYLEEQIIPFEGWSSKRIRYKCLSHADSGEIAFVSGGTDNDG